MTIIVIVLVLVLLAGWIISTQRRLVVMDENVNNAMSQTDRPLVIETRWQFTPES